MVGLLVLGGRMASVDRASLSVFGGNQEEAIVALEFAKSDGIAWGLFRCR
jgi:hypothetical protein